jgi:hypothetical protein
MGMNGRQGNPLALGLVLVRAAAIALAVFLPLHESNGAFRMIRDNTLIQHGGWPLIVLAVGIAIAGFRSANQRKGSWAALAIVLCALAGFLIYIQARDNDSRTLYPVGLDGTLDTSRPMVASLGIAVYVAAVGSP